MLREIKQLMIKQVAKDKYVTEKRDMFINLQAVTAVTPAKYPSELVDKQGRAILLNGSIIHLPAMEILVETLPEQIKEMIENDRPEESITA